MIPFFAGIRIGIIDIRFWNQFQYPGIDSSTVRKLIFAGIGIGTKKF